MKIFQLGQRGLQLVGIPRPIDDHETEGTVTGDAGIAEICPLRAQSGEEILLDVETDGLVHLRKDLMELIAVIGRELHDGLIDLGEQSVRDRTFRPRRWCWVAGISLIRSSLSGGTSPQASRPLRGAGALTNAWSDQHFPSNPAVAATHLRPATPRASRIWGHSLLSLGRSRLGDQGVNRADEGGALT